MTNSAGDTTYVQWVAVPEPSTYAALGGLAALAFALWRRRRG
ncbi:MAG: PEP-CTERM sorting domain-containing protein [Verrucomicrobiota bacterium]